MELLACGHVARQGDSRLCRHLLDAVPNGGDVGWVRLLSAIDLQGDLACLECAGASPAAPLVVACEGCVAAVEDDVWYFEGFRGRPGIREDLDRLSFDAALRRAPAPDALADLQPVNSRVDGSWLGLTVSGDLVRLGFEGAKAAVVASVGSAIAEPIPSPLLPMSQDERDVWQERQRQRLAKRSLHVSSDGRFAAVVTTRGSRGVVVDLRSGSITMALNRGNAHVHAYDFACTFAEIGGRTVLVHATAWNRLELSDPATGHLLTDRAPISSGGWAGEPSPHYIDYFHGDLSVSPSQRWIVDDGWVWHPVGVLRSWDLVRWATENPWESEDGPSLRQLCDRSYYWGKAKCWLSDQTVAITGIGFDSDHMLAGVRIFDVETGVELGAFAGPEGRLFSDQHYLFSAGPEGVIIWDPATGERLGVVPDFAPTRYHQRTRELVEIRQGEALRWRVPGT